MTFFLALRNLHNACKVPCTVRFEMFVSSLTSAPLGFLLSTDRGAAFQRLQAVPPQLLFSLLPRWSLSCRLFGKLIFDNSPGFSCGGDKAPNGRVKAHRIPVCNCLVMRKTVEAKTQITWIFFFFVAASHLCVSVDRCSLK